MGTGPETSVTWLVENAAHRRGLLAEHGLSFLIRRENSSVLFDTGQGMALGPNAAALKVQLGSIHSVVLSHGHYDHTGGLPAVFQAIARPRIHLHPAALEPKFARKPDGSGHHIGMAEDIRHLVLNRAEVCLTETPTEIAPGLWCTGPIPRTNNFEDTGGAFYCDAQCTLPDPLPDDQALYFATGGGLAVILGCAHAGVINTLDYIARLDPRPVVAVVGGMHLLNANPDRMDMTIAELAKRPIQRLVPCHCTGHRAILRLWKEFPERCEGSGVGARLVFPH